MDDSRLVNVTQLNNFLKGSQGLAISLEDAPIAERYACIGKIFKQLNYLSLCKKEKRVVLDYLRKITGYKHTQLFRLIDRLEREGKLLKKNYHRIKPARVYTTSDIKLLEETDELHLRLSEDATKEILRREYEIFGHQKYHTVSGISHGHINSVDEITQWEILFCVPQLSERFMILALEEIFEQYPFLIFNFHSDRGKETINYLVADLLQRLLIKQTKSRSYHSGDNALVETKNGSVVRKNMGWEHINQDLTDDINCSTTKTFSTLT